MTHAADPWLPESALTDRRSCEPVALCLSEWSKDWLQGHALSVPPRWERQEGGRSPAGYETIGENSGYTLAMRLDGQLELASALLGREVTDRSLRTGNDRLLIRKLADAAIDDLARRIGHLLDPSDETASAANGERAFALPASCIEPIPLFQIEASQGLLVGIARKWAGNPRATPAPDPWRSSLPEQAIRLSALAGRSRLGLTEVENLGVGDVLTLDTPVNGLLAVCIDRRPGAQEALSVVPGDDKLMLQIEKAPAQW